MVHGDLISIIIPVWNVEPFLRKCLDSLLAQTYQDYEVILVDDGSPDNCGAIIDEYAAKDARFIAIHTENQGVCAARNVAMKVAKGKYLGFVDPDDWCDPDMYEYLMDNLLKYEADMVACRYYRVIGENVYPKIREEEDIIMNSDEAIHRLIKRFDFRQVFWNKLFKRELFDGIDFPEGHIYEGTIMVHKLCQAAEKIVLLSEPKYYYYSFEHSYVNSLKMSNYVEQCCACIIRYNDLAELYPDLQKKMYTAIVTAFLHMRWCAKTVTKQDFEKHKEQLDTIFAFFAEHKEEFDQYEHQKSRRLLFKILSRRNVFSIHEAHVIGGLVKRKRKFVKLFKDPKPEAIDHTAEMTPERQAKLDELHVVLVEILLEIDRICRENGLKYFLYGGTLLGALRNGKIIAWDDDMDIVMYREDYEKFKEICKTQLDSKYFMQTCFNDPQYPMLFGKVRKNNTYVREVKWDNRQMHKGIYVDILPLDYFPEDEKLGNKILKMMGFMHRVCALDAVRSDKLHTIWAVKFLKKLPMKFNYWMRERVMKYSNKHSDHTLVCSFGSHYRPMRKRVLQTEWFGNGIDMEFEGHKFMAPEHWEGYILHLFGENYMELPPEEKRVCHGDLDSIKF